MRVAIIVLLLFQLVNLKSQTFSINGFFTDSLYLGVENRLKYESENCEEVYFHIEPKVKFEQNGCEIQIHPSAITNYDVSVYHSDSLIDQFKLYSTIVTLKLTLLCENVLLTQEKLLPEDLLRKSIGIQTIINCPWERESCEVGNFTFVIEYKSGEVFREKVSGWKLPEKIKSILISIKKGDKIKFDEIVVNCPGDSQSFYRYLEFTAK